MVRDIRSAILKILPILLLSALGPVSAEAGLVAHWPFSNTDGFNDVVGDHNPDAIQNVQLGLDRFGDPLGAANK